MSIEEKIKYIADSKNWTVDRLYQLLKIQGQEYIDVMYQVVVIDEKQQMYDLSAELS